MTNKTIHEYALLSSADAADELLVWDSSAGATKRTPVSGVIGASLTGGGTIATGGYTLTMPATGTPALASGVPTGQTIHGGTAANEDLILAGTTNATRTTSYVFLQPGGGKVGVGGVTAPQELLTIAGGGKIGFDDGTGTNCDVLLFVGGGPALETNTEIRIRGDGTDAGFVFGGNNTLATARFIASDTPTDTHNRFWVDISGKHSWGPGNTDVDTALYRAGAGALRVTTSFGVIGTGADILNVTDTGATGYSGISLQGTGTQKYAIVMGGPSEVAFGVADKLGIYDALDGAMRLVVDGDGNVGIGEAAPAVQLHVAGTILSDGDDGGHVGGIGFTNVSNVDANSSGTGTIKLKGATNRDSLGFIKFFIGTTDVYVPCFSAVTG